MPKENQDSRRIAAALAQTVDEGNDAVQIADMIAAAMRGIAVNLSPIIGKGGVAALYRRTLHLVGPAHPWLVSSDSSRTEIDAIALGALLAERSAAEAAKAGGTLLQTFSDVLVSLVGDSLGYRLLQPVWDSFPVSHALPDTSP
jgi:hypothetical protein